MKKGDARAALDALGIDWYCEQIIAGVSMTSVAKKAGVSLRSLIDWLRADSTRAGRSADARTLSAEAYFDRAEDLILKARNSHQLAKAREFAHHARRKAACIAPRDFGNKVGIEASGSLAVGLLASTEDPVQGARRIAFTLQRAREITKARNEAKENGRLDLYGEPVKST